VPVPGRRYLHVTQQATNFAGLVSGHCRHYGKALSSLLNPTPRAFAPDEGEYQAPLGALGVLVGLALASSAENVG
jgi:hypothetical protein